ncbi:hypothetical protein F2Q68_00027879 [Brassica cretica]|uniref:Serine incorporator n=1 Tax=Brassica cretica TaxID=69181 RepID=A0A8S9IEB2_BRACR|nr:hypothetical protein F2Q68_00027879 [Brassica cretica]
MNDPRVRSFQISPGDLEAAQLDDLIREIEQKSLFYYQEKKKSLRARYIYGTIFLIINLCAWFIRDYAQKALTLLPHVSSCGPEGSHCFHTLGVLRRGKYKLELSLAMKIFFLIMFLSTWNTMKLHQAQNTWHSDNWSFKFLLLVSVMVASFFIPQLYIQIYGEIARVGAGIFLGLQLISVIEFITWWNNYWMPNNQSKQSCSFGFVMSIVFYIGSVCGIAVMYYFYVASTACALNIFFISLTVILLIIMMVMSLHSKVKSSLMSSGIMASYIVFLCWSAIRSEPSHTKCNAHTQNGHTDWITVLSFLIAIGAIVMATFSTGIDSESFSFQFRKDEAKEEDDIPYSYGFFHLVFSLGAMFWTMNDPRVRSFQISPGDLEAAQLDDLIREIEQKSLFYHQEKKKSLRARYIYGTIFLIINLCAWFIRDYAQKALTLLPRKVIIFWDLSYVNFDIFNVESNVKADVSSCGPEGSHCFHTLGVLRVSLGCFVS